MEKFTHITNAVAHYITAFLFGAAGFKLGAVARHVSDVMKANTAVKQLVTPPTEYALKMELADTLPMISSIFIILACLSAAIAIIESVDAWIAKE